MKDLLTHLIMSGQYTKILDYEEDGYDIIIDECISEYLIAHNKIESFIWLQKHEYTVYFSIDTLFNIIKNNYKFCIWAFENTFSVIDHDLWLGNRLQNAEPFIYAAAAAGNIQLLQWFRNNIRFTYSVLTLEQILYGEKYPYPSTQWFINSRLKYAFTPFYATNILNKYLIMYGQNSDT